MDQGKNAGMAAALRLTREGRLTEAVAVLKRTLGAPATPPAGTTLTPPPTGPVPSGRWATCVGHCRGICPAYVLTCH